MILQPILVAALSNLHDVKAGGERHWSGNKKHHCTVGESSALQKGSPFPVKKGVNRGSANSKRERDWKGYFGCRTQTTHPLILVSDE